MTLVIMAAGMGSRFGGLKQIEPIDEYGNFIIDYSIYDAIKAGFTKVVFIIKKENYDIFRETVGARVEKLIETEYVFQELDVLPDGYSVPEGRVKPWGTGHAILCCKDKVHENFAIINSDDFYGRDAYETMAKFLKNNHDESAYSMVGYKVKNTLTANGSVKRGICHSENGYLVKLIESSIEQINGKYMANALESEFSGEVNGDDLVSMNLFGFTPKLFKFLEDGFIKFLEGHTEEELKTCEYLIPSVVYEQICLGDATVKILETDAVWQGVTYKEDKEQVVSALKKLTDSGVYPPGLWK